MSFCRSRYSWPTGRPMISWLAMLLLMVAESLSIRETSAVTVTASVIPATPSVASARVCWASRTWAVRVTACIPERLKVSVYVPGGSAGRR